MSLKNLEYVHFFHTKNSKLFLCYFRLTLKRSPMCAGVNILVSKPYHPFPPLWKILFPPPGEKWQFLPFKPFLFCWRLFRYFTFLLSIFFIRWKSLHTKRKPISDHHKFYGYFIVNLKSWVHIDIVKGRGYGWISKVSCAASLKCDPVPFSVPIFQQLATTMMNRFPPSPPPPTWRGTWMSTVRFRPECEIIDFAVKMDVHQ
jgi:hypothetical protein